ncbi:MAG: phosphoribosyltransferase family protein [Thermodesulfobacteriota bacterium]
MVMAGMLDSYRNSDAIVLAIPAGGVPVAAVIANQLKLHIDVAVISKITLPWNTEVGYGAVAFDGTVRLNEDLLPRLGLTEQEIQKGIDRTLRKVTLRANKLRGDRPFPDISQRLVILIDDGLASGFTMLVAIEALRKAGAGHIVVTVPTGHCDAVQRVASKIELFYCANIRSGCRFAVADAYEKWTDVDEEEVVRIMAQHYF